MLYDSKAAFSASKFHVSAEKIREFIFYRSDLRLCQELLVLMTKEAARYFNAFWR